MRHARRISICLLLGVVTTVAVAWALSAQESTMRPQSAWYVVQPPGAEPFLVVPEGTFGLERLVALPKQNLDGGPLRIDASPPGALPWWAVPIDPDNSPQGQMGVGWPFVCLRGGWRHIPTDDPRKSEIIAWGQWNYWRARWGPESYERRLPVDVVWPGAMADAALFGLLFWLLSWTPGILPAAPTPSPVSSPPRPALGAAVTPPGTSAR